MTGVNPYTENIEERHASDDEPLSALDAKVRKLIEDAVIAEAQTHAKAVHDMDLSDDEARSIDRNRLLRERMLDAAERRGLPLAFPLLDTEDLARVTFPDIWGGFDELVLDASQRYEASSVLIGRVRPESAERNRWTYHFSGEQHAWTGEPELVVNRVADVLAAEFAIGGDAALERVELAVAGRVLPADWDDTSA